MNKKSIFCSPLAYKKKKKCALFNDNIVYPFLNLTAGI